jgi:hypothetical protein
MTTQFSAGSDIPQNYVIVIDRCQGLPIGGKPHHHDGFARPKPNSADPRQRTRGQRVAILIRSLFDGHGLLFACKDEVAGEKEGGCKNPQTRRTCVA